MSFRNHSPGRAHALGTVTACLIAATSQARAQEPLPPSEPAASAAAPTRPAASPSSEALQARGCSATARLEHAGRSYFACGEAGVWVFSAEQLLEQRHSAGEARDLFLRGDDVWVESVARQSSPLSDLMLLAAPLQTTTVSAAPAASVPSVARGSVLGSEGRFVTVSIGKAEGVRLGDRIEAYATASEGEDAGGGVREETVLIGKVVRVSEHQARVEVGFGELAARDTEVRKTSRQETADMVAPARMGRLLSFEGTLRPFLPVDGGSFAVLGDLAVTYLAEGPWFARAELHPLGAILGTGKDGVAFGALASAGYDQTYFGIGLGLGGMHTTRSAWDAEYEGVSRSNFELAVTQTVRLGARDGLNLTLRNALRLSDGEWAFGWFDGHAQLPVGNGSWLMAHGSGGDAPGYALGEVGFRRLVRGNGADGSLFVRPSAGFAAIAQRDGSDRSFQGGPMIGMHLEYRLGL